MNSERERERERSRTDVKEFNADTKYVFGYDYFCILRPRLDFHAFQPFFFSSVPWLLT